MHLSLALPAGRGILIDYWAHRQKSYSPLSTHSISVTAIREIAASKNITFRPGDILLIRSGFVDHYNTLPQPERDALKDIPPREYTLVGCEQSEEMLTFLHDEYFAAVVGDTPAFESWPSSQSWHLHHTLLPKWGIPMGEMWDLERLAEVCERLGRWEFLVTSAPSNMPGMCRSSVLLWVLWGRDADGVSRWCGVLPKCDGVVLDSSEKGRAKKGAAACSGVCNLWREEVWTASGCRQMLP